MEFHLGVIAAEPDFRGEITMTLLRLCLLFLTR